MMIEQNEINDPSRYLNLARRTAALNAVLSKPVAIRWIRNDGGRAAASFKGTAGDCAVRAYAIAAGVEYRTAYDLIAAACKAEKPSKTRRGLSSARTGVHGITFRNFLIADGWTWVPTMQIGSGCTVHLRREELPAGRLIVFVSKHYTAVIDGVINDTYDPSRDGQRCVYGYCYKA